jgi:hypothetical protein
MAAALLACAAAYTTPHRADFALSERASVADVGHNSNDSIALIQAGVSTYIHAQQHVHAHAHVTCTYHVHVSSLLTQDTQGERGGGAGGEMGEMENVGFSRLGSRVLTTAN